MSIRARFVGLVKEEVDEIGDRTGPKSTRLPQVFVLSFVFQARSSRQLGTLSLALFSVGFAFDRLLRLPPCRWLGNFPRRASNEAYGLHDDRSCNGQIMDTK